MNASGSGQSRRVMFAGGGTGGHISPGLAIAERLAEMDPPVDCVFVCSNRAIDATMLDDAGQRYVSVPAAPPSVRPAAALRFARGYRRSKRIVRELIRRESITDVVSLGGFVAAPAVSAAFDGRTRVTLLNLDAVPGKASRLLARRCDRVWSTIPLAPGVTMRLDRLVGMPVRRRAIASADRGVCRTTLGLASETRTLLVTGASQGATSINRFMTMFATCKANALAGWQVIHLSGEADVDSLRRAYQEAGVPAVVLPFVHDMGLAWGTADLAISRAGANSVAEVALNGVPTIFLPYPYHRDAHQRANAAPLESIGGAIVAEDLIEAEANMKEVGLVLSGLLLDGGGRLDEMRAALAAHHPGDAAAEVAGALIAETSGAEKCV